MLNLSMALYVAVLFFVLTPGVLVRLPPKGSKMVVTLTHAVVFAVVLLVTYKKVAAITGQMSEGFLAKRSKAAYMTGVPPPGGAGAGAGIGGNPVVPNKPNPVAPVLTPPPGPN